MTHRVFARAAPTTQAPSSALSFLHFLWRPVLQAGSNRDHRESLWVEQNYVDTAFVSLHSAAGGDIPSCPVRSEDGRAGMGRGQNVPRLPAPPNPQRGVFSFERSNARRVSEKANHAARWY
jgi:hypothetical protein